MGTYFNQLVSRKTALILVPPGSTKDCLGGLVQALLKPRGLADAVREARAWATAAVAAVRGAAGDNPYRGSTDEEIAAVIMKEIEAKFPRRG